MILSNKQLRAAVHGWVDTEEVNGYTCFYRFTERQRDYYKTTEFDPKQTASAGEFMEFLTDGDGIRFEYSQKKASSQNFYFFDLYVNGKMITHVGNACFNESEEGIYEQDLPLGEKTVKIVFPNLSATGIRNVELRNATMFRPVTKKLKYIAYGDSITQGYTSLSPSLSYVNLLGAELDADVYNLGIGGELFMPEMTDQDYPVTADMVTVAYGTNDWSHSPNETAFPQRDKFLKKITEIHKDAAIFVLLPVWRGPEGETRVSYSGTLNDYRDLLRTEAQKYPQVTVIEGIDLVPHHPDFYVEDVLHPNALGFTQYAKNLLAEIRASGKLK